MPRAKTTSVKRVKRASQKKQIYKEIVEKKTQKKTPEQLKLLINPEDTPDNPLDYHKLMVWLADTGWVEGYVRKRISPMDAHLYEDFAQSVWVAILSLDPIGMMEVWYHGKGCFVNYIKRVIDLQLCSTSLQTYKVNKHFYHTHALLSDEQWRHFEEGDIEATDVDVYPVKYMCPTGNKKKMVIKEFEEIPITAWKESLVEDE